MRLKEHIITANVPGLGLGLGSGGLGLEEIDCTDGVDNSNERSLC